MYQEERLAAIIEHLQRYKRISVEEICEKFAVSRDTARRDLVKLDKRGAIIRTRGGAILPTLSKKVSNYEERMNTAPESKKQIGRVAATFIKNGDYLILDASTTVQFVAEYLTTENNVIVTNSIEIAAILTKKQHIDVHLLGGQLRKEQHSIYGTRAIEMLKDFHVDKLFLGTCGLTSDGLTNLYEEEGFLMREMIKRADQVFVLLDHSKFGKRMFHKVCGLEQIDFIITDKQPEDKFMQLFEEHNIEVIVTKGRDDND